MYLKHPTSYGRRQPDGGGAGHFGAPRGDRNHRGVDFLSITGEPVSAPCSGTITRIGVCYADDQSYRLVEIAASRCKVIVMYVNPTVAPGEFVLSGDRIGYAQNIVRRYPSMGMSNHVHLELYCNSGEAMLGRTGVVPADRVYLNPELFF